MPPARCEPDSCQGHAPHRRRGLEPEPEESRCRHAQHGQEPASQNEGGRIQHALRSDGVRITPGPECETRVVVDLEVALGTDERAGVLEPKSGDGQRPDQGGMAANQEEERDRSGDAGYHQKRRRRRRERLERWEPAPEDNAGRPVPKKPEQRERRGSRTGSGRFFAAGGGKEKREQRGGHGGGGKKEASGVAPGGGADRPP